MAAVEGLQVFLCNINLVRWQLFQIISRGSENPQYWGQCQWLLWKNYKYRAHSKLS